MTLTQAQAGALKSYLDAKIETDKNSLQNHLKGAQAFYNQGFMGIFHKMPRSSLALLYKLSLGNAVAAIGTCVTGGLILSKASSLQKEESLKAELNKAIEGSKDGVTLNPKLAKEFASFFESRKEGSVSRNATGILDTEKGRNLFERAQKYPTLYRDDLRNLAANQIDQKLMEETLQALSLSEKQIAKLMKPDLSQGASITEKTQKLLNSPSTGASYEPT
ncbi:MAG: hypothetical protein ACO3A2_08320, partial [Bdellovibrionia bacterium]